MIRKIKEERQKQNLNKNKKTVNILNEICPICKGREFLLDNEGKAYPCDCHEIKMNYRNFISAGIPEKFLDKDLSNFETHNNKILKQILTTAEELIKIFDPKKQIKQGLILRGGCGTGKTHIAIGILKALIQKGYKGIYINIPDLLKRIRATYSVDSDESETTIIDELIDCDIIVFDDLGAEAPTEWVRDRLYLIINTLYEKNKTLIVTTNCTLEEMSQRLNPRITSRLCEICQEWSEFPDVDYRRLQMR